jgi:hypothetical protein
MPTFWDVFAVVAAFYFGWRLGRDSKAKKVK